MSWINRLLLLFSINTLSAGSPLSAEDSYSALFNSNSPVHATPHITNIIRNGSSHLSEKNKMKLIKLGLHEGFGQFTIVKPNDLDEVYDSNHFRFYYTFDGYDAVENISYVIEMGNVFEQVYKFYSDTLGFTPPPLDPQNDHNLYEIYIEALPAFYFGVTYTTNSNISETSCASYIRMRNSYTASQFSDHTEIENIKVTAVHEFFHAIQFGYNCYERLWLMESTAVWSEDELYNGINDHYRYMPSWFSNSNKPIDDESSHMYGSFIFFQYIDEHLGGPETIKACWDKSHELSSQINDISFNAVDAALISYNSSFEDALNRMKIANKILSDNINADPYSYEESEGYKSVINGPYQEYIIYENGNTKVLNNQSLDLYESLYYSIETNSPFQATLLVNDGDLSLTCIIKEKNKEYWSVRSGYNINIDPEIGIEWITLLISSIGRNNNNWDYTLKLENGYSEDFTLYKPYPNPSIGGHLKIDLQVINQQKIYASIVDLLGREMWSSSNYYSIPESRTLIWNGLNNNGEKVPTGVYFFIAKGLSDQQSHKITLIR